MRTLIATLAFLIGLISFAAPETASASGYYNRGYADAYQQQRRYYRYTERSSCGPVVVHRPVVRRHVYRPTPSLCCAHAHRAAPCSSPCATDGMASAGLPPDKVATCGRLGGNLRVAPDGMYQCIDRLGRRMRPDGSIVTPGAPANYRVAAY